MQDDAARPHIDSDLVSELIRSQFPEWAHLAVRPVPNDGWDNRTFHVGTQLSARLPSAAGYVTQVRKEVAHLPTIAAGVSLEVPAVVALGAPGHGYPFEWTVRRWIPGTTVGEMPGLDRAVLARDLAGFLSELWQIDPSTGPAPGAHSSGRGAPLEQWSAEVAAAIDRSGSRVDSRRATALWAESASSPIHASPVWFHGDLAVGNLLTRESRLAAVIDFGCTGVGDPACDLAIAWTFFEAPDREEFRRAVHVDNATWLRGSGWALWKALITLEDPTWGPTALFTLNQLGVLKH